MSDEDELLNMMERRPQATFNDYNIGNPISLNGGYNVDYKHQSIVNYIQSNLNINDDPDLVDSGFNKIEFMEVFSDMKYYCDMVNGVSK